MLAIVSALSVACVLGLLFESTRLIGIVCAVLLIYMFPISILAVLLIAIAIHYH